MNNKICKISLFSFILATVAAMPVNAAVKTKNSNRSYADAYQQINALRYQQEYTNEQAATTASASGALPVVVEDKKLADDILSNKSTTSISELESCAMIYPNGVFKWAIPESGVRKNPTPQCVSVVELRDANTNAVLATTTVAAGDSMKCNIDYFPQSGYNMAALSRVELPADAAPTIEDVTAVMNAEQKQNAGLKIAAGALIAGVAGNMLAPKQNGDSKLFGTGKTQLIDTAIGATAGAGIMAASTYSGKVAGDTIKSTAVNAASGMIVGNMLAGASGGDNVLATTKCTITEGANRGEHDCVIGNVQTIGDSAIDSSYTYIINKNGEKRKCSPNKDDNTIWDCDVINENWTNISVDVNGSTQFDKIKTARQNDSTWTNANNCYERDSDQTNQFKKSDSCSTSHYLVITSAHKVDRTQHAYAVFSNGLPNKPMGYKFEDWINLKGNAKLYYRNGDGSVGNEVTLDNETTTIEFIPSVRDAESGGLIDMSNQARAKGTIVGTAAGGAIGGLAGYQGAKDEVTERWLAAQREYEGSLSNFVCMTGGRFLSAYNSYVEISEPLKME